jgi:protein-L-isoaspartate(D-aspartate) O-methyltransferase
MLTASARMIQRQLEARGIRHPGVLRAMAATPRERFVPAALSAEAYDDAPLAIGYDQTISQPYMVASMTELLDPQPTDRVLEIGTGSGYQTAILAQLVGHVYTLEIVEPLERASRVLLAALGYANVTVRGGNGWGGWPEEAPFDKILITAAPVELPRTVTGQLRPGGRMIAPVGEEEQYLTVVDQDPDGTLRQYVQFGVMFVPMVGGPR